MSESKRDSRIRRILFALDSPERGVLACVAAVHLAAELHAEVRGLFIEDLDLLRASALPFAQEISLSSAALSPITFESMERTLQAMAEQFRAYLAERAREANIAWSFDVRRAAFFPALLGAVENTDLLVVGPREVALNLGRHSQAKRLSWPTGPLIVLFDGRLSAQRALEAATEVQRALPSEIVVHVVADDPRRMAELQAQATALAPGSESSRTSERIRATTIPDVLELARRQKPSLVLVGADNPLLTETGLRVLIERLECLIGVVP